MDDDYDDLEAAIELLGEMAAQEAREGLANDSTRAEAFLLVVDIMWVLRQPRRYHVTPESNSSRPGRTGPLSPLADAT